MLVSCFRSIKMPRFLKQLDLSLLALYSVLRPMPKTTMSKLHGFPMSVMIVWTFPSPSSSVTVSPNASFTPWSIRFFVADIGKLPGHNIRTGGFLHSQSAPPPLSHCAGMPQPGSHPCILPPRLQSYGWMHPFNFSITSCAFWNSLTNWTFCRVHTL